MDGLRFSVLGPLDVHGSDGPIALGGPRQRAVLGLLLVHAGELVSTEVLIDGLWGDDPPATAERTLHAYLARLRGALEPDRATATTGVIGLAANGYGLRVARDQVDATAFEDALVGARRELAAGETEAAAARLRRALALWRGPAFSDLVGFPGITPAATRLDHLRADAQVDSVEAELALGRHEQVVPRIEELVAQRPLDERLWAALAMARYRSGLQGDALETIAAARRVLVNELGIEPGPQLRDLQAAVLAGDPRLDPPTRDQASAVDHSGLEGRAEALERFRQA
jgi:DNA-binding SARP family transcriptional activator